MKSFNFKNRNLTSGPHLIGLLLVLAGIFALGSQLFLTNGSSTERELAVGTGALLIGILIISSYSGTLIAFNKKRVKEYVSIAGFKLGDWVALPDITRVRLASNSYISSNSPNGISPTLSGKVTDFKILLYSNTSQPIFSFNYSNKQKSIKQARLLAAALNVELELNISEMG